jgi:hypothetical protein
VRSSSGIELEEDIVRDNVVEDANDVEEEARVS